MVKPMASEITERSVLLTLRSINGIMFVAELVASILADSTGLLADSLDMLADATVYGIALDAVGDRHRSRPPPRFRVAGSRSLWRAVSSPI